MFPTLAPKRRMAVSFRVLDVVAILISFTWTLIRLARNAHRRARTTRLNGLPSKNLVLGFLEFFSAPDSPEIYEVWAERYTNFHRFWFLTDIVVRFLDILVPVGLSFDHFRARPVRPIVLSATGC